MKLTFTKTDGTKTTRNVAFASPISKSVNKAKDLFYFIDLDSKDHLTGTYNLKCCKISRINKKKSDFKINKLLNQY
jgi:hypothetical protein